MRSIDVRKTLKPGLTLECELIFSAQGDEVDYRIVNPVLLCEGASDIYLTKIHPIYQELVEYIEMNIHELIRETD